LGELGRPRQNASKLGSLRYLSRCRAGGLIHTSDLALLKAFTLFQAGKDGRGHQGTFLDRHVAHRLVTAAETLRQRRAASY